MKILLILLTIFSQYSVYANDKDFVTIWGELENPGLYEIGEDTTLDDLMQKAIPLPMASIKTVLITRLDKIYHTTLNSDFILKPKDIIKIRLMSVYEGQSEQIDYVYKVKSKNPNNSLMRIMKIKIDGIKVQKNEGGIEFRPKEDNPKNSWTRVLIKISDDNSLIISSRKPYLGMGEHNKLKYQIVLEKNILEICKSES